MRALLLLALAVLPASAEAPERKQLLHVLNRLTYGPRPGDLESLANQGVDAFIGEQLRPSTLDDSACEQRLAAFKSLKMTGAELERAYPDKKRRRLFGLMSADKPKAVADELAAAKITRAYCSKRQLQEVMTDFWFNHFNVSAAKGQVKWLVTPYERDVIRPRVFGKFRDLLGAVARSPAMLVYLDNAQSTIDARYAPAGAMDDIMEMQENGKKGKKGRAKLGLNENYARELMELHTLGVDGGYTQKDVTELARILTGWSLARPGKGSHARDFEFRFKRRMHDPGAKVLLGTAFPWTGEAEGERALDLLSRHPSTARHLATKLCRRFVADEPPASCVDQVSAKFRETDGDLSQTLRAVLASEDFRSPERFRAKVKTPLEFAVSAMRATGAELRDPAAVAKAVAGMGQPLYRCEPPTGYPDRADAWVSAGALLSRMRAAQGLFTDKPDAAATADEKLVLAPGGPEAVLQAFLSSFLGGEVSERTLAALRRRLDDPEISGATLDDPTPHLRRGRLAALVLGSPEFQRR